MPRILMFVYTYIPDDPRVITEARTAVKLGYEVTAIGAAFSNGISGTTTIDHINITTVPIVNSLKKALLGVVHLLRGRVPQETTPPPVPAKSNALSILFFYLWILRLSLFQKVDFIHAHEHQAMPIGWLLATLKRVHWVYDAHEHVPENRSDFQTFKARMAVRTEAFFLKRADAVITVGQRLANDLTQRGVKRVVIIGNWKPLERFVPADTDVETRRTQYDLARFGLVVSFFGVLNRERQVDVLIEAIKMSPEVGLLIAGKGELRDMVIDAAEHHDNIIWLDWLPYDLVPAHVLLSDVIYGCLDADEGNARYMAPNKLFDAFAAGKAMIVRRGVGEIGQILEDENAAILLDVVTPQTVSDAFKRLKDDPTLLESLQSNARNAGQTYNWDTAEHRLQALYADLVRR